MEAHSPRHCLVLVAIVTRHRIWHSHNAALPNSPRSNLVTYLQQIANFLDRLTDACSTIAFLSASAKIHCSGPSTKRVIHHTARSTRRWIAGGSFSIGADSPI